MMYTNLVEKYILEHPPIEDRTSKINRKLNDYKIYTIFAGYTVFKESTSVGVDTNTLPKAIAWISADSNIEIINPDVPLSTKKTTLVEGFFLTNKKVDGSIRIKYLPGTLYEIF